MPGSLVADWRRNDDHVLRIGGQISSVNIIKTLILPSIVCMVVPSSYLQFTLKGELGHADAPHRAW